MTQNKQTENKMPAGCRNIMIIFGIISSMWLLLIIVTLLSPSPSLSEIRKTKPNYPSLSKMELLTYAENKLEDNLVNSGSYKRRDYDFKEESDGTMILTIYYSAENSFGARMDKTQRFRFKGDKLFFY